MSLTVTYELRACVVRPRNPAELDRSWYWRLRAVESLEERGLVPHPRIPTSALFEIIDATFPTCRRAAAFDVQRESHRAAKHRRYRALASQLRHSWPELRQRLSEAGVRAALWSGPSSRQFPDPEQSPQAPASTQTPPAIQAGDHRTIGATTGSPGQPAPAKSAHPVSGQPTKSPPAESTSTRRTSPRKSSTETVPASATVKKLT